jgi:hypothetical protein
MQTLLDMSGDKGSIIVFPVPIELIRPLLAGIAPSEAAQSDRTRVG